MIGKARYACIHVNHPIIFLAVMLVFLDYFGISYTRKWNDGYLDFLKVILYSFFFFLIFYWWSFYLIVHQWSSVTIGDHRNATYSREKYDHRWSSVIIGDHRWLSVIIGVGAWILRKITVCNVSPALYGIHQTRKRNAARRSNEKPGR